MSVSLVKNATFHPGYTPTKKPKRKHHIGTNRIQALPPFLFPIEGIAEKNRLQYAMQSYSIVSSHKRAELNAELVQLYEANELLKPNLPRIKQAMYQIGYWTFRNQFLRTAFKRLVQLWLFKRYKGRCLNTIDFATLEEPKRAIELYDSKAKGMYVFEAASLRRSIQDDLSFTDWLFPDPQPPKNPWTNCAFTIPQLLTILHGLYAHQMTSVFLEGFKHCDWNLREYATHYKIPIKLEGLKSLIGNKTSEEYTELMCEFIEDEFEYHEIDFTSHLIILKWAVKQRPEDTYMKRWTAQFEYYNRLCILNGSRVLDRADDIFDGLHNATYALFLKNSEIARLGRERLCAIPRRNLLTV